MSSIIKKKLSSRTRVTAISAVICALILLLSACGESQLREYASEYIPISKHDELYLVDNQPYFSDTEDGIAEYKHKWSASDKEILWDILANLRPSPEPSLRSAGALSMTLTAKNESSEITVRFIGAYAYVSIGDGEPECYRHLGESKGECLENLYNFLYSERPPLE